jgi:hypothetical protein
MSSNGSKFIVWVNNVGIFSKDDNGKTSLRNLILRVEPTTTIERFYEDTRIITKRKNFTVYADEIPIPEEGFCNQLYGKKITIIFN